MRIFWLTGGLLVAAMMTASLAGDPPASSGTEERLERLERALGGIETQLQSLAKATDDLLWFQRVGDVAEIDKITIVGPPNPKGEELYGIANSRHPLKIYSYIFVPRRLDKKNRHPLLILPHGGVHADFTTYHTHIIRELMEEGYVVAAPEYRGSTGYGADFWKAIDYGGLEVDDNIAVRDWAVENLGFVDPHRVGIVGWSHGGLIALLAVFKSPDKFQCAYAGVPVSDLLARMGYTDDEYREQFAAEYHLGKTANQAVDEYRKRSPAWNAAQLKTPLLIHTATNDRDVNVVEVEHLIQALKAEEKTFEYKIYPDPPGGHSFNRIDTPLARASRREIYQFLAKYLHP